ncbi:MAG: 30S ribosomal protein S2 [Nanoarchaeota archaeon]
MVKEQEQFLVPLDEYLKVGIHIGTKFRTKYMAPFIYKTRPDGLVVLNVQEIDKRIKLAANLLSQYNPENVLVVCRRENGWKAVSLFSKLTGIRVFAGRYPPGILTNPNLKTFIETKLILVVDPWPDKNIVKDAIKIGIPVIALCDTNNETNNLDLVIPCNNKGKKSLGLIFWILAREYLKVRNKEMKEKIDDFMDE